MYVEVDIDCSLPGHATSNRAKKFARRNVDLGPYRLRGCYCYFCETLFLGTDDTMLK